MAGGHLANDGAHSTQGSIHAARESYFSTALQEALQKLSISKRLF